MALPALPIISAITNAATGLGSAINQGIVNRKNRAFAQNMYNQQRDHANADWQRQHAANIEGFDMANQWNEYMWNKQNEFNIRMRDEQREYDSPEKQMERFRKAGINPNAMFGNLTGGSPIDASSIGSASAPSAPSTRGSSPSGPSGAAMPINSSPITSYLDTQTRQAQVDNLRKQNDVISQDIILKTLDATGKELENEKSGINNRFLKDTYITSVEAAAENLRKLRQDISFGQEANERANQKQPYEISKLVQDIQNARTQNKLNISQTEALEIEKDLKYIQLQMSKIGIQPNDKLWQRMLGRIYTMDIFKEGGKSIKDRVEGLFNQASEE